MENPWDLIRTRDFHIHPDDDWFVSQHNRKAKSPVKIQRALPPLPYIGNPLTARVVLLGKNPGYSEVDEDDFNNLQDLRQENLKSLTFESRYPFFYLDADFKDTNGYKWWWQVMEELLTACAQKGTDNKTALSRIACVQWHPYHSQTAFDPAEPFPTQTFNAHLVQQASQKDTLFVLQYGAATERQWRARVPEIPAEAIRLKSTQTPHLSRKNIAPADFDRLLEVICRP